MKKLAIIMVVLLLTSCMGEQGNVPLKDLTASGWLDFITCIAIIILVVAYLLRKDKD
jgi:hypothetical protein